MEPFGMFNFLKTLLSNTDFFQNNNPENAENKENNIASQTAEPSQPISNEQNASPPETKSDNQNAFTKFLSAHDARVKNTRPRR